MTTITRCNVAPLSVYSPSSENPWNEQAVNHLYRRVGFGATRSTTEKALAKNPSRLIDEIIDEALVQNPIPAPEWANWIRKQFYDTGENPFEFRRRLKNDWMDRFFQSNLRERMTLFWSNHFVTEDHVYNSPAYAYQYYSLLHLHALGNFKEFTRDIGLNPAMLMYLNGRQNTKNRPNENYARELYELFTLGVNNGYTQNDIEETARALTGWNTVEEPWGPITFDQRKFDNGSKTIFGETGNWGYEDVITILFEKHSNKIAKFICKKFYKYFVSPEVNMQVVEELADVFLQNDFEIAPVLRKLFKSAHFFDRSTYGVIMKSPIDVQVCLFKELDFELPGDFEFMNKIRAGSQLLGQIPLSPVDVAGWQGDTDWIGSATLVARWNRLNWYIWKSYTHKSEQFQQFVVQLMDNDADANNVTEICKKIVDHFLPKAWKNASDYDQALEIFKDQVPDNYFEDGTWTLSYPSVNRQVYKLLLFIIRIPEFQLK